MQILDFALYLALLLFVGMPLAMETGRRVGHFKPHGPGESDGGALLDSAVYGLLGLLLAFTFSGAAQRFDHRRELITQETNAIGTAYLRVDLLQPEAQARLRPLFRQYVDARLATSAIMNEHGAALESYRRDVALQNEIWREAVPAAMRTGNPGVINLVTGSLNDMIDITTTRLAATQTHPPHVIFGLLVFLALASAFQTGVDVARGNRPWVRILLYSLVVSGTVYVILDMEFPRAGFIRVDAMDQLLVQLRDSMNP